MMKRRASTAAMASMMSPRPAPNAPGAPGAKAKLTAITTTASRPRPRRARMLRPTKAGAILSRERANIASNQQKDGPAAGTAATFTSPGRFRTARQHLGKQRLVGTEAIAHARAQLFRDLVGVDAVANDLRADEDDELGAVDGAVVVAEQLAQGAELVEQRQAGPAARLRLGDQPAEQHGLAVGDRDRALHPPLPHGGRERIAADAPGDVPDLLLDGEQHGAVGVDARRHAQNDAGVAIVDIVHHRRGRDLHRYGATRGDRDLVADLQHGDLVVEHDQ